MQETRERTIQLFIENHKSLNVHNSHSAIKPLTNEKNGREAVKWM